LVNFGLFLLKFVARDKSIFDMKIKVHNILFAVILSAFLGCDGVDFNERILTKAAGKPGEIILVIDSVQWAGELGAALRRTLNVEVPGLGRDESRFYLMFNVPTQLK
jgi:hypothetical protein